MLRSGEFVCHITKKVLILFPLLYHYIHTSLIHIQKLTSATSRNQTCFYWSAYYPCTCIITLLIPFFPLQFHFVLKFLLIYLFMIHDWKGLVWSEIWFYYHIGEYRGNKNRGLIQFFFCDKLLQLKYKIWEIIKFLCLGKKMQYFYLSYGCMEIKTTAIKNFRKFFTKLLTGVWWADLYFVSRDKQFTLYCNVFITFLITCVLYYNLPNKTKNIAL